MGTIGIAKKGLAAITLVTTIAGSPVSAVLAQAGASGLVRSPVPGGQPSSALDRATGLAEQPFYTAPMPAPPTEQYIPDRRVYVPQVGREIDVPGHFGQRTPDGQIVEPPMTIPNPNGGPPVFLPGGAQPGSAVPPMP
jgi:hypothetical protein